MNGWEAIVWHTAREINGHRYSANVRKYMPGCVGWVLFHEDGYDGGEATSGIAATAAEAMGACEDWIERLAMGEDATP